MANAVRYNFLFLLLLLQAAGTFAQQGSVKGHLADTVGHEVLKGALITVTSKADSSFTRKSFSKEDASFEIHHLPFGNYSVRITFQGFEPVLGIVHIDQEHPLVNMGTLYLRIRVSELDTVRVEEPPMILKKDTIAYNASRWRTQPYAPVADLLAELPGVKVNSDGSLTVNGQPVDRILVDGKPFFNGDPKMALQHLPAEIIKQIQFYQTTDERSSHAGIPSGTPGNKTLNLVLKINRRRGDFGKAGAGVGPDGVYAAVLDLHHMNGKQQLSVVGDAGNVNSLNTGKAEEQVAMSAPGDYGIARHWNGGMNYRDTWNDHTDLNGSFMSSQRHVQDTRQTHTLNLFPGDSSTILNRQTNSTTEHSRQQLHFTVENKLSASQSLTVRSNMQLQHTGSQSSGTSSQTSGRSGTLMYESTDNNTNSSDTKMASADILYLQKGSVPSRSFSAGLAIYGNHYRSNNHSVTHTNFIFPAASTNHFNQQVTNTQNYFSISPSITYTIPVGKRDLLDLQSHFHYNSSTSRNEAFRYNEATHQLDLPDPTLSNAFNAVYNTARALMNYKLQRNHYTMVLGAGIESDHLQGKNLSDNSTITNRFTSFLPSADLIISQNNGKSFQVSYRGKPIALTVQQLQPVTTTADSLFIQQGNPLLKQPFTHSFTLSYSSIRTGSQRFFSATLSGNTTVNVVQHSITLLENGAQVFRPVNMNGSTHLHATAYGRIPLARERSDIGLTGNISYFHEPGLSNGQKSYTRMLNLSGTVAWSFNAGKGLSFDINAISAYNMVRYSQDLNQANDYYTETISSKVMYAVKDWSVSLTECYSWNNGLVAGYQPKAPILSLNASRRLFKRKEAEIKLLIADLLNQQSGAMRTATVNSITDLWAITRGRYAMLSFVYNISRFKAGK